MAPQTEPPEFADIKALPLNSIAAPETVDVWRTNGATVGVPISVLTTNAGPVPAELLATSPAPVEVFSNSNVAVVSSSIMFAPDSAQRFNSFCANLRHAPF